MRRREFIALVGGSAITWPLRSYAQQPQAAPPKRIGLLQPSGCANLQDNPLHRGLTELGWINGRDFVDECVSTFGRQDQILVLARELVLRRPDVIAVFPGSYVRPLLQKPTSIPIVITGTPDPVRLGLVANLARPEGNVTGVAQFSVDVLPKRIEFLKQIVPQLKRLAIIRSAYYSPKFTELLEENLRTAAGTLGFAWQNFQVAVASDYDEIFARVPAELFQAAYIVEAPLTLHPKNTSRKIQLAMRSFTPAVAEDMQLAKGGLLLAYSQDFNRSGAI